MGKTLDMHQKGLCLFLLVLPAALLLLFGCAAPQMDSITPEKKSGPVVEGITVRASSLGTSIEIVNSQSTSYTAFRLIDPPRVILDIRANPGANLPPVTEVNDANVKEVRFEKGEAQDRTTRMVATLSRLADYKVTSKDNLIQLVVTQKQEAAEAAVQKEVRISADIKEQEESEKKPFSPSEPRILLKARPSELNQILGIDFTMLEQGKSRLIVTTDRKSPYHLDRKGPKLLVLQISDATIPPLLLRQIDTSDFTGALEKIIPGFSADKKEVSLAIHLREMVPFHVRQTDNGLTMDFGRTSQKPAERKIVPLQSVQAEAPVIAREQPRAAGETETGHPSGAQVSRDQYKGERMYLDFVNADVTHILRLINEVSKENIIWDPSIKGRNVSMILKGVPWDEALELILQNNDLAKRYVGKNILWITTKAKMKQIQAEEEAEERKKQKEIDDELKKKEEGEKKAIEEEPLRTEFIPADFAKADVIKGHIVLSPRGKMSIDTRTNTIIIKDTASSIEEAKNTVKQFDVPVKQIMIEARIVDATNNFSRDLGLRWSTLDGSGEGMQGQYRKNDALSWAGTPPWAVGNTETSFSSSYDQRVAGAFSTNSPTNWAPNLALSFARLSGDLRKGFSLDASLALAESEGTAKVISAPKVIATEGTAASISSGDTLIIPATENVASTTLPANLSLQVTPTSVSYNNFITLSVTVTDDQAPSTSRILNKSINTSLMVKSGETVVIGGIIKESESDDETGVPLLKDVPALGWLFKARSKVHQKSELLIFITPTVIPHPQKTT